MKELASYMFLVRRMLRKVESYVPAIHHFEGSGGARQSLLQDNVDIGAGRSASAIPGMRCRRLECLGAPGP